MHLAGAGGGRDTGAEQQHSDWGGREVGMGLPGLCQKSEGPSRTREPATVASALSSGLLRRRKRVKVLGLMWVRGAGSRCQGVPGATVTGSSSTGL